jgi:threonine/homoserine/homoserine lactone efflux protein
MPADAKQPRDVISIPSRFLYREGFLVAATNPKAVLFFTALFPQFIDVKTEIIPQFLVLTGIFMAISYASHLAYAAIASRARGVLDRPFFSRRG